MKVDQLSMRQFSAFEEVTLGFCPGINVFLGTNATGKSHTMKALCKVRDTLAGLSPLSPAAPARPGGEVAR
jgi:recombinational DNA repair ATPase RecF